MALSANASLSIRNEDEGYLADYIVSTGAVVYKHAYVVVTTGGVAHPAANEGGTAAFVGLAQYAPDNNNVFPITGDGTQRVGVLSGIDVWAPHSGITAGALQQRVFLIDDATVSVVGSIDSTVGPECGYVIKWDTADTTKAWVRLGQKALGTGS